MLADDDDVMMIVMTETAHWVNVVVISLINNKPLQRH